MRVGAPAGVDGFAKLWSVKTGKLIKTIKPERHLELLRVAAFSPDDKLIALGGGAYTQSDQPMEFSLWDLRTQQKRELFTGMSSTSCLTSGTQKV